MKDQKWHISFETIIRILCIIAVLYFFNEVWVDILTRKIVSPYMNLIKASFFKDLVWTITALAIVRLIYKEIRAFKTKNPAEHFNANKGLNVVLFICLCFYSIDRFSHISIWKYERLKSIPIIAYTDIIYILGGLSFVIGVVDFLFLKSKNDVTKTPFFLDNPIEKIREDVLGYKIYAENLAFQINESVFSKPFSIGITSQWGNGKTSFINLLKRNLNTDIVQINFSPWHYNSTDKMLTEFFNNFESKIAERKNTSRELSNLLKSYSRNLTTDKESYFSKIINTIDFFNEDNSLKELYDKINDKLVSLDLDIVVFIDDLDRLNHEEIYEVLRLIRNSANFKRTCFVVAYDRDYVVNALKQLSIYSPRTYLEKLFQVEITLPYFSNYALENLFWEDLMSIIKTSSASGLLSQKDYSLNEIFYFDKTHQKIIFKWISSIRDSKRLVNSLLLNGRNLFKEVNLKEFIHIELLRLKFPDVYTKLYKNRDRFFTVKDSKLVLRDNGSGGLEISDYLVEKRSSLLIDAKDCQNIVELLSILFNDDNILLQTMDEEFKTSIKNPSVFWVYFSYGIIPEILSNESFLNLLDKPLEESRLEIENIINSSIEFQFIDRLKSVSSDEIRNNVSRFKNLLDIFIYVESIPMVSIGYDYFYNYINPQLGLIFTIQIEDEKVFLNSIFNELDFGIHFKAGFINFLGRRAQTLNSTFTTPIFSAQEIESLLLSYLKYLCNRSNEDPNMIYAVWEFCNLPAIVSHLHPKEFIHKYVSIPEARNIFIQYIAEKGLDSFIRSTKSKTGSLSLNLLMPIFQTEKSTSETLGDDTKTSFKLLLASLDNQKWPKLAEYKKLEIA